MHSDRVKSLISPDESLTPGLLYVGVATLSGSILARNRFLPTRLLLPPAFLLISANHFLPKTTANLTSYFGSLEETYFPTFSQKHDTANQHTQMAWHQLKDATENGRQWLSRGAGTAIDRVQDATGLKLRETLGWTQAAAQRAEGKLLETVKAVEDKVQEAKKPIDRIVKEQAEEASDIKKLV